jgi:N6-adenosine-specific RNA methylase IME4
MTEEIKTTVVEEQLQQLAAAQGLAVNDKGELVLNGFTLSPTALVPDGSPSFEEWDVVGSILRYFHTGMQFWLGDWMNFGEKRYGEKYSQALEASGYELKTLQTYAWVANKVKPAQRVEAIPYGHYVNGLAGLDESDQARWVKKLLDNPEMTRAEFQKELRAEKRKKNVEQQLPDGYFRVFYVDFPWKYREDGVVLGEGGAEEFTKAEKQYPTMSMDEIIDFAERIKSRAMHDAVMFMWVTSPMLFDNPGPREVIEAAGFEYKACFVWDKQLHNPGKYNSVRHEFLLLCTRGSATPDRLTPQIDSVVSLQRGDHSSKPEEFRKIIERLYDGPYLELFGREQVDGWTVYGNDPALLGEKKQPKEPKQKKQKKEKAPKAPKTKKLKKGKKVKGELQDATGAPIADLSEEEIVEQLAANDVIQTSGSDKIVTEDPESTEAMATALAMESPGATIVTDPDELTPDQIARLESELGPVMQKEQTFADLPVNLCKKHRKEPKPCQKCKAEKQEKKKSSK